MQDFWLERVWIPESDIHELNGDLDQYIKISIPEQCNKCSHKLKVFPGIPSTFSNACSCFGTYPEVWANRIKEDLNNLIENNSKNINLLNDGCICIKCKNFSLMSEPNQSDGTFKCWSCRNRFY